MLTFANMIITTQKARQKAIVAKEQRAENSIPPAKASSFHCDIPTSTFWAPHRSSLLSVYFVIQKKERLLAVPFLNSQSSHAYSSVRSTIGASGAFFITEAIPFFMFTWLAYIWLEPMT